MQGKLPLILLKGFGSMGILAVCVLMFIAGLHNLQGVYQEKLDEQIHSTKMIALVNEIQLASTEILLCRFAKTVTSTPTDRDVAKSREVGSLYTEILNLIGEEPASEQRDHRIELVKEIKAYCNSIIRESFQISPPSGGGMGGLRALVGAAHTLNEMRLQFEGLGAALIEFRQPYLHIQADSSEELRDAKLAIERFTIAGAIGIFLAIAAFSWFMKGVYDSIRVLLQNTERLSKSESLLPMKDTGDELGQLDKAFRNMATDLESAKRARQEFFDTVSHDMRTPLSS